MATASDARVSRKRAAGRKLVVWIRRYLPCEIVGTVGEFGSAVVVYVLTDSPAAAAIAATIGATVGPLTTKKSSPGGISSLKRCGV